MKALIISDVHANWEAFNAVIEDCERGDGFDQVWSLGDLVGYGPDPGPCIDMMRSFDARAVVGNHDLASVGRLSLEAFNEHAATANKWTSSQLSEDQMQYIRELPLRIETEVFTMVHGSPRDPLWEYVMSAPAAVASFLHFQTEGCLVGHSHIPFICRPQEDGVAFAEFPVDATVRLLEERIIINPGAVGQPRDRDPRASYAVYNDSEGSIIHRRVEYDVTATQAKMQHVGLPRYLIDRLTYGQ